MVKQPQQRISEWKNPAVWRAAARWVIPVFLAYIFLSGLLMLALLRAGVFG